ncbi:hypothetical protein QAD02_022739 [Eretmocerus hayati]|uniref:Uncharacterized protein n=1 Tax=Eretmocerus hayati TaxID=131215 RepID=A0ACC2PU42_9HYME|nr:hypothetical protein QAD02_022739 [Eretmocerus hayati]
MELLGTANTFITPNQLAKIILETITGQKFHNSKAININNKALSSKGDISFQLGLEHWRGHIITESDWYKHSENILQYFMLRICKYKNPSLHSDLILEIFKQNITQLLEQICATPKSLQFTISLSQNFVLLNFKRQVASYLAIKTAIDHGPLYGSVHGCNKIYKLHIDYDDESVTTNMRLNLLKTVSVNLLKCQGYLVQDEECNENYVYTIKSEGSTAEGYKRYLCGAVLNDHKSKERGMTQKMYLRSKVEKVKELNAQRCPNIYIDKNNIEGDIEKIANAAITYELLSTKHSIPVIVESSDGIDRSIKEASFILYNNVRMTAILDKYAKLVLEDEFPQIVPIEEIETFNKIIDDESWSLVYNYIMKYPDVLKSVITVEPKLDINIQSLWFFVSSLCHDFSKYYRRNRILMKGVDFNDQIISIATERLHLLRALRIVLRNSLSLLGVEEVMYM